VLALKARDKNKPYSVPPAGLKRAFSAMLFLGAEFLGLLPRLS
jgi:hypothetical protein